jgi:hypothetical protein
VLSVDHFHHRTFLKWRARRALGPTQSRGRGVYKTLLFSSIMGISVSSSYAALAGESVWLHNGSTIRWVSDGDSRRAYYVRPRAGLEQIGIFPGQLLFDGFRRGSMVAGQAHTFKPGCPPLHFSVSANLLSETTIDLRGRAPRREAGCVVTSFVETELQFDYAQTPSAAPSPSSPTLEPSSSPTSNPRTTTSDTPEACKKFPLLCN